jgi:hypothetical protein
MTASPSECRAKADRSNPPAFTNDNLFYAANCPAPELSSGTGAFSITLVGFEQLANQRGLLFEFLGLGS